MGCRQESCELETRERGRVRLINRKGRTRKNFTIF